MTLLEQPIQTPRKARKKSPMRRFTGLVFAVLTVVALGPVVYMMVESVRVPFGLGWTLHNWSTLFHTLPIVQGLKNSAILAISSSLLTVIVTACAGFSFAKLPFRGARIILFVVIVSLALPLIADIVPEFLDWSRFNMVGSYVAPIVVYSAFNAAFAVIFFTNFFLHIPDEFIESAISEGAGYGRVLLQIVLPMALPALVTIGVLDFLLVWNDLLVALIFLPQQSHQTVSVLLATINSAHVIHTQELLAGALLSVLPNMLVFLGLQRYLILGFSTGVEK